MLVDHVHIVQILGVDEGDLEGIIALNQPGKALALVFVVRLSPAFAGCRQQGLPQVGLFVRAGHIPGPQIVTRPSPVGNAGNRK